MNAPAPPGVVAMVTGEALLARLDNMSARLGQVESNTSQMPAALVNIQNENKATAERVGRLERWRAFCAGALAFGGIVWTAGLAVLAVVVAHK